VVISLEKCREPSVVKLRDTVKIPPPKEPVMVKTFSRDTLPDVLRPAFAKDGVVGVTINGRYVAILKTDFEMERQDVLNHELVHAYITLASPNPLPFWFQEASAVHFSTNKGRKYYGKPSEKQVGVTEGKVVDLAESYKQKLQSFHFLIDQVGSDRFYEWHRQAVVTGIVDARPLLGLPPQAEKSKNNPRSRARSLWFLGTAVVMVVVVVVVGLKMARRSDDLDAW
jgi:hypothetical protein